MGSPEARTVRCSMRRADHVGGGLSAATSRRVAEKAGLKHQLVHYYFHGMDELFTARVSGVVRKEG
jgi:DNA-binding transcriptional regulator YbjK